MTAKDRAECLVFNHDLTPMLNPSEDGKEAATRLIAEAIDAAVNEATEDDPQWDATDAAHPAWWRGNDAGANAVAAIALNAAHGMKHSGVYGNDLLERMAKEIEALLAIARQLAAKCVRGNNACTACGSCNYGEAIKHNDGCSVVRLENYK